MHQIILEEGKLLRVTDRGEGKRDMIVYVEGNRCLTACTLTKQGEKIIFVCYQVNPDGTLRASAAKVDEIPTMMFARFEHPASLVLVMGDGS